MKKSNESQGIVSVRLLAVIATLCLATVLLYAAPPPWWASRGVTSGTTLSGTADYAAANQGQLKNIATAAYNELSANLPGGVGDMTAPSGSFPGGTGYQLTALISSWSGTTSGTTVEITGSNTADYAGVNLGQLKHVSRLFYKRLIEAGFASYYPWEGTGNPPNDYAAANIGQVKNLFSFDVTTGTSTDGVPDMWEQNWFGTTGLSGTSLAPSGDGLTIYQSYEDGVSPIDYYNGVSPTLTIISGSNQSGSSGALLPAPLVVQVTGTSGQPLVNAPVIFTVTQGVGVLAPDNSGTSVTLNSMQVLTGTNGYATIWFQQPFDASFTSTVAATAEGSEVDFNEMTTSDTNAPAASSSLTATVHIDGSVLVTWVDNSDNEPGFTIQSSTGGGGSWITQGTSAPDTTSYLIPSSAGVLGGDWINVMAGSTNSGSVRAVLPVPIRSYSTLDISATNTVTSSGTANVISMASSGSGTVSYCFVSGTLSGTDTGGSPLVGANQITVNTWSNGTTSSGSFGCDAPSATFTMDGTFDDSGLRDESINADPTLYQYASGSLSPPSGSGMFYTFQWIESQYRLGTPPPSVVLMPNGNAYGTVVDNCYIQWSTGSNWQYFPEIDNAFSTTWVSGSQSKQSLAFSGTAFTSTTANLLTNNTDFWAFYGSAYEIGPWGGMVLGCSQAGYFGVGGFGVYSGTAAMPDYFADPGVGADLFIASYICTTSGTAIFYDPTVSTNYYQAGDLPSGFTVTGTAFTPAAMNDNGYAIGGQYYWNGSSLNPLSDITAVGTAISSGTGPNLGIGYDTASGTVSGMFGMLWLMNAGSGSATTITMQSLVAETPFQNEVQGVIPTAISGTDSNNMVSILCSGSVLEGSGTAAAFQPETLRIQVNASTPSGTATPPQIRVVKIPPAITFQNPNQAIYSNDVISGIGTITTGTGSLASTSSEKALLLLPVQINAYRPQMVPKSVDLSSTNASQMIIPQAEVSGTGVHIRVNGDNENTNLLKVTFSCPAIATMSNLTVGLQCTSGTNLQVWPTNQKGTAMLDGSGQGTLTLDGSGNATIWVEALVSGTNVLNFPILSGTTPVGYAGTLHFVNYDSFTVAFSGETFGKQDPTGNGMFPVAQKLYLEGYNIAFYDVNAVNDNSGAPAYAELSNQIQNCFVKDVGLFGHSHGAGQTYNTCTSLAESGLTNFSIDFTGYVDAIEHSGPFNGTYNILSETRYPPGSAFLWNYYERNNIGLRGNAVSGAAVNLNVNTTSWGSSLVHAGSNGIAASPKVQANLQSAVETHVPKY